MGSIIADEVNFVFWPVKCAAANGDQVKMNYSHFLEGLFCIHGVEFLLQFYFVSQFVFEDITFDLPGYRSEGDSVLLLERFLFFSQTVDGVQRNLRFGDGIFIDEFNFIW